MKKHLDIDFEFGDNELSCYISEPESSCGRGYYATGTDWDSMADKICEDISFEVGSWVGLWLDEREDLESGT